MQEYKKPIKGLIARTAISCIDPKTGQLGSWLFSGDNIKDIDARVSPVFTDCYELFKWANSEGWQAIHDAHIYYGA